MKPLYSGLILLAILLFLFYVPVRISYHAESIGTVLPVQEWKLLQDQTGRLSSMVIDYKTGAAKQIDAYQFEQGDFSGLHVDIPNGLFVHAGDTLVRLYSTIQAQEIQEIKAELALYSAQFKAETTGEKAPVVQEAENKLYFAEQDLKLKESLYNTKKRLKDEGLIAVTEFETVENDYRLAKIQTDIAKKGLDNVQTGLKKESVGITEAHLRGLRERLALLEKKGLSFVLRAPFTGYVVTGALPEELLTIQSAEEYFLQIPIKVEQLAYLDSSSVIRVTDVNTRQEYTARYLFTMPKVEVLDNRQVALLAASLRPDSPAQRISTGISVRCYIDFGKINQREYLKRLLNFNWY